MYYSEKLDWNLVLSGSKTTLSYHRDSHVSYRNETLRWEANLGEYDEKKKFAQILCFYAEIVSRQALHLTELVGDFSNLLGAKILTFQNFPRHSWNSCARPAHI